MSKSRPAKIGLFVMGATVIAIAGVFVFGGTRWFEPSSKAILFFEESVEGLSAGSEVTFRGVRVGEVERLRLDLDPETADAVVVATIRLTPQERFSGGAEISDVDEAFNIEYWVEQGLVGQLNAVSFLTGQLSIQLNFDQDANARTRDVVTDRPQIPVVRSEIEQVRDAITEVDWRGLVEKFESTLVGITSLTEMLQDEFSGIGESMQATATSTEALVEEIRDTLASTQRVIERLGDDASTTLSGISSLTGEAERSIAELSGQIDQTLQAVERFSDTAGEAVDGRGEELSQVLTQTERTLSEISTVVQQLETITDPRSQERDDLQRTLRELAQASAAINRISEMIERNPQSIFFGSEGDRR